MEENKVARTIVLTNQKGGVGKTTTSSALAAGFARKGNKVLAVDMDPQGNLGFSLGVDIDKGSTIYEGLLGEVPVYEAIRRISNIDIIQSNILLSSAEASLKGEGRELLLKKFLEPVEKLYDYIIIDCGLKHELLTVNALVASDYCIIPVQAHFLASEGIPDVLELVKSVR